MSDADVNSLVWKYLGYRFDEETQEWDASAVFPKWAAKYPQPPDLVGVTRTYSREVDEPVLRAVQALQKSVPTEHKDNLRAFLAPLGWPGYRMQAPAHIKATTGLTPNMTRRAQVSQWLLYYREALHGVPLDEVRAPDRMHLAGGTPMHPADADLACSPPRVHLSVHAASPPARRARQGGGESGGGCQGRGQVDCADRHHEARRPLGNARRGAHIRRAPSCHVGPYISLDCRGARSAHSAEPAVGI